MSRICVNYHKIHFSDEVNYSPVSPGTKKLLLRKPLVTNMRGSYIYIREHYLIYRFHKYLPATM